MRKHFLSAWSKIGGFSLAASLIICGGFTTPGWAVANQEAKRQVKPITGGTGIVWGWSIKSLKRTAAR